MPRVTEKIVDERLDETDTGNETAWRNRGVHRLSFRILYFLCICVIRVRFAVSQVEHG